MCAHREEQKFHNITLALYSDIFYYISSVLVHIKDKMMVMRYKMDIMIHWMCLQVDKHHPSLFPCWAGLPVIVSITPGASLLFQILIAAPQG